MPVVVEVRITGLEELATQFATFPAVLQREAGDATRSSLALAEAEIKELTPRKTGRLFSAWQPEVVEVGGQWVGRLSNDVSYAPAVEYGSRPHDIVAHGNALMIPVAIGGGFGGGRLSGAARSGQQVGFFASVRHPGSKGVQMAELGLERAKPEIINQFKLAVNRALATIKGAL